jgi:hypothetical protein
VRMSGTNRTSGRAWTLHVVALSDHLRALG